MSNPAYLCLALVFLLVLPAAGLAADDSGTPPADPLPKGAVLRLGGLEGVSRRPTLIALAALSFSPSLLLWSTQPLKDGPYAFTITAEPSGAA